MHTGLITAISQALLLVCLSATHPSVAQSSDGEAPIESYMEKFQRISEEIEKLLIREDPNPPAPPASGDAAGGNNSSHGSNGSGADGGDAAEVDPATQGEGWYGYDAEMPDAKADAPGNTPGKRDNATFPSPKDVGDGQDDDAVARQFREAAENEPDPKAREGLWDVYRKYKKGK